MTVADAKAIGRSLLGRARGLPLPVVLASATAVVAILLLLFLGMSQSPYGALYEGLTPKQGGAVIAELQKLGIPYRLSRSGTVISVPAADLGKARLELASSGTPGERRSSAWKNLEGAPMTASQASVTALRLQAMQGSIESAIEQVSGARKVRVLIALPRSSPFLADQPKPKASVVMMGAQEPDAALGRAVAQLVAGAVSGLAMRDVVVATGGGAVLYPVSSTYDASRQMAIRESVESAEETKIRALLTPILGAGNFRSAVSADIAFGTNTINSVTYGPRSYQLSSDIRKSKSVGNRILPIGIPGALSNQPPGPSAAPLPQRAATQPTAGASAAARPQGNGAATAASGQSQAKPSPVSTTDNERETYAIDRTTTESHPAGWKIGALSVSVAVNKAALGTVTTAELKNLITATTTIKLATIAIVPTKFVASGARTATMVGGVSASIVRAALLMVAALALLGGVLLPMRRWLANGPALLRLAPEPQVPFEDVAREEARIAFNDAVGRIRLVARSEPLNVARTLQKWLK